MTPLDNLRRLVAGWRGEWRVDAHEGITLSHDGEEWPIGALDGDAVIMLVELLNAIRPAVDGATAEIERLTADLAAARAVPPDVEAAIDARDAEWQNRIATFHQGFDGDGCESGDPIDWTLSALGQAKCTVEDAVGDFIEGHAKRLCDAAGGVWHDEYDSWASQVHDVLNHLRGGADGAVIDGRASQPATVGGLLAHLASGKPFTSPRWLAGHVLRVDVATGRLWRLDYNDPDELHLTRYVLSDRAFSISDVMADDYAVVADTPVMDHAWRTRPASRGPLPKGG